MKLHHYSILFLIMALAVIVVIDHKGRVYQAVLEEKEVIDNAFDTAVDSATNLLLQSDQSRGLVLNKDGAKEEFYQSLYAAMGYLNAKDKQEEIGMYIPIVVVTGEDGYYVNYTDLYKASDGYHYYTKRWSEKLTYDYEDDNFIYGFTLGDTLTMYDKNNILDTTGAIKLHYLDYKELRTSTKYANFRSKCNSHFALQGDSYYEVKRTAITKAIEDSISYYINLHNQIAFQQGISYQFQLPIIDNSDFARAIDSPSFMVMFQGYPYRNGLERYNRVTIAGAKLSKNEVYYLEQKSWYFLYHTGSCPLVINNPNIIDPDAPYYDYEDCIRQGAYACESCHVGGANVPNYYK